MPAFRFRLQVVLKIADQALKLAEQRLAEELRKRTALMEECYACQTRLQDALQGKRRALIQTPSELGKWQMYVQQCNKSLQWAKQRLKEQEEVVEKARKIVVEAKREVEKLKRLKEKQWLAFLEEERRNEQKVLDETGQVLYQRQINEVIF